MTVVCSVDRGVAHVELARPDRLNALTAQMREELYRLWRDLADHSGVRAVLLTGRGRAFCAGVDAGEIADVADRAPGVPDRDWLPSQALAVPIVVAVHGACIGAGLRLLADADVVLAAESAWLRDPHVSLGQSSGPLGLALAGATSPAAVAPLVLAGSAYRMSAADAMRRGLVSDVVADDLLSEQALTLARAIADQPAPAVRATVSVLRGVRAARTGDGLAAAWAGMDRPTTSPDERSSQ